MQTVVNISLNGNSYQLEEPGYNQLRTYLERAEARLKDNPDRAEVMGDLEQAIGEKCRGTLSPTRPWSTVAEVGTHHRGDGPGRTGGRETAAGAETSSAAFSAPRQAASRASASTRFAKGRCGAACATASPPTWVST